MIVMVPEVGSAHVGSLLVAVTAGALAGAFTVTLVVAWQAAATLLTTVMV